MEVKPLGITLSQNRFTGETVVIDVSVEGTAQEKLLVGDKVATIEGVSAANLKLETIHNMLVKVSGTRMKLGVIRDDEYVEVVIDDKNVFEFSERPYQMQSNFVQQHHGGGIQSRPRQQYVHPLAVNLQAECDRLKVENARLMGENARLLKQSKDFDGRLAQEAEEKEKLQRKLVEYEMELNILRHKLKQAEYPLYQQQKQQEFYEENSDIVNEANELQDRIHKLEDMQRALDKDATYDKYMQYLKRRAELQQRKIDEELRRSTQSMQQQQFNVNDKVREAEIIARAFKDIGSLTDKRPEFLHKLQFERATNEKLLRLCADLSSMLWQIDVDISQLQDDLDKTAVPPPLLNI